MLAFTSIHSITVSTKAAIDYISNESKTLHGELVSSFNCDADYAAAEFEMTRSLADEVVGDFSHRVGHDGKGTRKGESAQSYHLIQSFSPDDNVTPEEAHEIGKELLREFLGGEYEYVIATHVDKGHIHNHVIFNATSITDLHKFRSRPYVTANQIMQISNQLCAEHGLSQMQLGRDGVTEPKYSRSKRSQLIQRLDFALDRVTTRDEFEEAAGELGVTIDTRGKHLTYALPGQERAARDTNLSGIRAGKEVTEQAVGRFTPEGLAARFAENEMARQELMNAIKKAYQYADSQEDLIAALQQDGIKTVQYGLTIGYEIPGVKRRIKDDLLPPNYRLKSFSEDWRNPSHFGHDDFSDSPITEKFDEQIDAVSKRTEVAINLGEEQVAFANKNGVLVKVVVGTEEQSLFLPKKDLEGQGQRVTVSINSGHNYTLRRTDSGTEYTVKGETVIRSLQLQQGIKPKWVSLNPQLIRVGAKGISISLAPSGGTVFLPAAEVRYNRSTLRYEGAIGDDWHYYSKGATREQSVTMNGKELVAAMDAAEPTLDRTLAQAQRIGYAVNTRQEFKRLSGVMTRLQENAITGTPQIQEQIAKLELHRDGAVKQLEGLIQKINEYNTAVKAINAANKYKDLVSDIQGADRPYARKLGFSHSKELLEYQRAKYLVKTQGLNPDMDKNKMAATIDEMSALRKALEARIENINSELVEWRITQTVVQEARQPEGREQLRNNDREHER